MRSKASIGITIILIFIALTGCKGDLNSKSSDVDFKIEYEKFTLENGLTVIFHIDRSDPVVAVNMTAHVGSSRELPGKTGFAHLFEHLLFNESENLGRGGLDNMSARIGGSGANGSTSRDRTNYFQTVPADALEKMIWAEADKLGWFINTVTEPVLAKEKQVVKNEKRQNYDNRPYGNASYVVGKNLYPASHPYSWQVIGSLEDLTSATLQDVKDFYNRWYSPNNVTLVLAGDFNPEDAKIWVEKYFGEIKRGEELPAVEKIPALLTETKRLYYEDKLARLPDYSITWPTVHQYHKDAYALGILANYLSQGKRAPLYKVLVEEKNLTSRASMRNYNSEIAGEVSVSVRAYNNIDLDSVSEAIKVAFSQFENEGIPEKDLNRIKAGAESSFYRGLSSTMGKANQLAHYSIFAGDPGYVSEDIKNILAVTAEDIMHVYNKYIKDKAFVESCFIPAGRTELATEESVEVTIPEENISADVGEGFDVNQIVPYEKTPSSFDRTVEPSYGTPVSPAIPEIWEASLENGVKIFGIENYEVPLVEFSLKIKGGLLLEDPEKIGTTNMMASLMNRGTKNRTPEELEEAIDMLGSSIRFSAGRESINISGSTLKRNYNETMSLVKEMLLEPRWDEQEFDLIKQGVESDLQMQKASPNAIASNRFSKIIYGDHIFSNNMMGTEESVAAITISDLKDYYELNFSPTISIMNVVGAISKSEILESMAIIESEWQSKEVDFPDIGAVPTPPERSKIYFYDIPGAKQSVFYIGYPAMSVDNPDYYPANVMNYILGGGGFASRLTQELRQAKGYTYGIRSSYSGTLIPGPFSISSGVKTSITYEAISLVKEILDAYPETYTEDDLDVTKSFLTRSNARAFETSGSKLNMLNNISNYNWPADYVREQESIVKNMTVDQVSSLAAKYANPDRMYYLVVGDAETQLNRLKGLGYGNPILIND